MENLHTFNVKRITRADWKEIGNIHALHGIASIYSSPRRASARYSCQSERGEMRLLAARIEEVERVGGFYNEIDLVEIMPGHEKAGRVIFPLAKRRTRLVYICHKKNHSGQRLTLEVSFPTACCFLITAPPSQFQPKLFSAMIGCEMPCSRTLRPLLLPPLCRLPRAPPMVGELRPLPPDMKKPPMPPPDA